MQERMEAPKPFLVKNILEMNDEEKSSDDVKLEVEDLEVEEQGRHISGE